MFKNKLFGKGLIIGLAFFLISSIALMVSGSMNVRNIDSDPKFTFEEQYDFVIIAYSSWYEYNGDWDLQTLVDWHNTNDTLRTNKVNLADILQNRSFWVNGDWGDGNPSNPYKREDEDPITNFEMFNDTQAKVRNYIRYAHHELGVRYALLVGDNEHISCRKMYAHGEGAPAPKRGYDDNVPADMYFGCLNGTWNDDEDTYSANGAGWGENATLNTDNGVDEADWSWEVAIGRLCPDTTTELSNAIRKTIAYMDLTGEEPYLHTVSLAGHHAGWGGQAEWGAEYSKQLNGTICTDWDHTTYGFNSDNYTIMIVDANPNRPEGVDFTDENSRGIFNSGVHVWYQCGHGSETAWANSGGHGDAFDISDVQALTNTKYGLVFSSIPCRSGQFDTTDCLSEAFVNDDNGAFASIMNSRYGWGSYNDLHSTNHFHGREFFDAYFHENIERLGDMLADAGHDCDWLLIEDDPGTIRWALFEKNLIGSPAVKMKLPTFTGGGAALVIDSVTGGLSITAVVKNIGDAQAFEIYASINITGGLFMFPRDVYTTLENLPAGESMEIKMLVFGIGLGFLADMPEITVTASAINANTVEETATAKVIGPLVIIE